MISWLSELICPNANNVIGVVMTLRATYCKGVVQYFKKFTRLSVKYETSRRGLS